LIHKFRGLEIGANYGNTNMGSSNEMGEWEAYIKAGTGDDKTDIVVIADFWQRLNGVFSRDNDISRRANGIPFGGIDIESSFEPGRVGSVKVLTGHKPDGTPIFTTFGGNNGFRLRPGMFFGQGGTPVLGVNTPLPHSAPNAAFSPFYKDPNQFNIGFLGNPALL